jgi:hypothetical protein
MSTNHVVQAVVFCLILLPFVGCGPRVETPVADDKKTDGRQVGGSEGNGGKTDQGKTDGGKTTKGKTDGGDVDGSPKVVKRNILAFAKETS